MLKFDVKPIAMQLLTYSCIVNSFFLGKLSDLRWTAPCIQTHVFLVPCNLSQMLIMRSVGRARREWITEVRNKAFQFVGDHREIARLVHNPFVWRHAVCQFLRVHAPPGV